MEKTMSDAKILSVLGSNPNVDEQKMLAMAQRNEWDVLKSLARNPSATERVFKALIEHKMSNSIVCEVASNSNISPELMMQIATGDIDAAKIFLARNEALTDEAFHVMAESENENIVMSMFDSGIIWKHPKKFISLFKKLKRPEQIRQLANRFGFTEEGIKQAIMDCDHIGSVEKIHKSYLRKEEEFKCKLLGFLKSS
jgi:hypothetical protein